MDLWFESEERMMAEYDLVNDVFKDLKIKIKEGGKNELLISGDYLAKKYLDKEHGDYVETFGVLKKFSETFRLNGNFYIEGITQKIISVSLTDELSTQIKSEGV
jgi:hypothetical protein